MKTNRMSFTLIILFLLASLFGCNPSKNSQPKDRVVLQLKWLHQAQFAGCYVADKKGLFKLNDIEVTLIPGGPDLTAEESIDNLLKGKSHFLITGGDMFLKQRKHGAPLVAIAVIFQRNPYVYAVPKNSDIRRPQDFVGKTVMIPHDGKPQHVALLRKLGIPDKTVKLVPYKKNLHILESGEVDIGMLYRTGTALMNEAEGMELELIWLDDYGIKFYADTIVTSEKLAKERPDLVKRFLKATLDGWRYAIEHQNEAVNLVLQYDGKLSRYNELKMMKAQIPLIHIGNVKIGWMEEKIWEGMYRTLFPDDNDVKTTLNQSVSMHFLKKIYNDNN